ncbi:MAG: hypothetical protein GY804_13875 [Alphaproteobacteria bacterium]|nr:hypothetical protein [Alphaproteobacteria bacterium]
MKSFKGAISFATILVGGIILFNIEFNGFHQFGNEFSELEVTFLPDVKKLLAFIAEL